MSFTAHAAPQEWVQEADYVVVGSGSAGSVAAARLSEDGKHSVLVLEYGGSDIGPFIQMPAALVLPDEHGALRLGIRHGAGAAPQ